MTITSSHEQALQLVARNVRLREEPGGHYVALSPQGPGYFFVNRPGAVVLQEMAAGASLTSCLAQLDPTTASKADLAGRIAEFADEVTQPSSATSPEVEDGLPRAWSLRSELGDAADRCETFGMPL
jgi:hypothetical protein